VRTAGAKREKTDKQKADDRRCNLLKNGEANAWIPAPFLGKCDGHMLGNRRAFCPDAGLSTWAVVRLQRAEIARAAEELERYKSASDERIAAAKLAGDSALADAAHANEEARRLSVQAEELKAANLKLETEIAPRRLSDEQKKGISSALSGFAMRTVRVTSYAQDLEAAVLSLQIVECLGAANIAVDDRRMTESPFGFISFGIFVFGDDPQFVNTIARSLASVGNLRVAVGRPPAQGAMISSGPSDPTTPVAATVLVAAKPLAR
jgi:hypothetical protein